VEANVAKRQRGPGDEPSNSAKIQQPAERLRGTTGTETCTSMLVVHLHQTKTSNLLRYASGPKSHEAMTAT
jgi:hypothetical protein